MRVCIVSREFAPYFGAGIGTYAAGAARAWAAAGRDAHVLTHPHPGLRPDAGLHVIDTRVGAGPGFLRDAAGVHAVLRRLHRRHRFAYVEFPDYWAEGYAALRAARRGGAYAGAVLAVRLHTPTRLCRRLNEEAPDPEAPGLEECEESAMAAADVLISPTRSLLDRATELLRERGLELPRGEVVHYPFDAEAAARELGGGAEPAPAHARVLYVGRLERRKGVETLAIAALRLLDAGLDAEFVFVGGDTRTGPGGGSMLEHLRSMTRGRGDRVRFEPARPRDRLGGLVRSAAVCCFPSLWENFPNVCLEAMSLGACVLGSDAGGMGEMIEPGASGMLSRAGDADDLARTLRTLLERPDLRRRLGAGAPARVRSLCDPDRVVRETEALIAGVRPERREFVDAAPATPLRVRVAAGLRRLRGTAGAR